MSALALQRICNVSLLSCPFSWHHREYQMMVGQLPLQEGNSASLVLQQLEATILSTKWLQGSRNGLLGSYLIGVLMLEHPWVPGLVHSDVI